MITEKPFGTDLDSARALNERLQSVFGEERIYRIDHYLGRESVQNLLAMRFANGMFEPVWNRNHIDHVQIDIPETLSIEMRGSFYEETGAFRDMVVTHLFQVLGFVAMEPPTALGPKPLGIEREKVFESMLPLRVEDVVRGQYEGYRDEDGVDDDSQTETFVAVKAYVDNWRWEGVPFYLRTGKRMAESKHLLTIAYSQPPRRMFPLDCDSVVESFGRDHLTFELGEPGTISASFLAKVPGPKLELGEAHMQFNYDSLGADEHGLDPYERLIHDVLLGDRTLFTSSEAIERLWEISAPVLESPPPIEQYEPGSWGPEGSHELISPRRWHLPATTSKPTPRTEKGPGEGAPCFRRTYHQGGFSPWLVGPRAWKSYVSQLPRRLPKHREGGKVAPLDSTLLAGPLAPRPSGSGHGSPSPRRC